MISSPSLSFDRPSELAVDPDAFGRPSLAHGLHFEELYHREGLRRLDAAFLEALAQSNAELHAELVAARGAPDALDRVAEGELLLALAPFVERFLAELFDIEEVLSSRAADHHRLDPVFECQRGFVQQLALRRHKAADAESMDGPALREELEARLGGPLRELELARQIQDWRADEERNADALDLAARYAAWAHHTEAGRHAHRGWALFKAPGRRDPMQLIPLESIVEGGLPRLRLPHAHQRRREGFGLTDEGAGLCEALGEARYCIYCQHQGNDSCATGLKQPKTGEVLTSKLGREMLGCPLEERISEFQECKAAGMLLAPLALIAVDNPMCAGTGHRICNDCMVSCIYQRGQRDPVNIPQAETRTLKDVLDLPWGFEIYSLLTRWNPLNLRRPLPREASGYTVLVVGLGPAGFTLAHHLLNEGHAVVAIDGLKIEPLAPELSGRAPNGERMPFRPIRDLGRLRERLDERVNAGFGGVAEYGITVRWDKNYLRIIRLLLERRGDFSMHGGVRFGGTLDLDSALEMGFDHVALCMGAGKPTVIPMENGLVRGVRQASDFLMALQLTGAARRDTVANLHLRLPVAVIGGGLTAIDTCTEALAYYPLQVEKFLQRYEVLVAERGEAAVRAAWNAEDVALAEEWLGHARAIREEREAARVEAREPRIRELLERWGGASIVYRRSLQESPSYRNNWEEVEKAFEEGIRFVEHHSPTAVETDPFGHAAGLRCRGPEGEEVRIEARSILVAAGTVPNTVLARERSGVHLAGRYFQAVDEAGRPAEPEWRVKPRQANVLLSTEAEGPPRASFFGDLHPDFAGNVVAAMASAKMGYPVIDRLLRQGPPSAVAPAALAERLRGELRATVHEVIRLTPTIVEVVLRAPLAARGFEPGQFYRLQNFEAFAAREGDTLLAMEGLALTGAWVDKEAGLLSTIVLEMGGSSNLCAALRPGEPVIMMGPTGAPTTIPAGETVMLVGGGLGNAVLFSIGKALREAGCRVLYFAGYKAPRDRYKVEDIHQASDIVVWACDVESDFQAEREQDKAFTGNIVQAMLAYGRGDLGEAPIALTEVDRIIAIGSDRMMRAVAEARHGVLAPFLKADHEAIGSINSPMQCMMKEICAQCLQQHVDPESGPRSVVFSCFNQDQPLDWVDFDVLNQRLGQNGLQEKLTRLWIERSLDRLDGEMPRV